VHKFARILHKNAVAVKRQKRYATVSYLGYFQGNVNFRLQLTIRLCLGVLSGHMPREASDLERALGRLLTAVQSEETRAIDSPDWRATHAVLQRVENLYWAAKRAMFDETLGDSGLRGYLGVQWLAKHSRVLPAVQDLELQIQDVARQA